MSLRGAVAEVLDELEYRYSPDQPRVPAGEPAGGQFGPTQSAQKTQQKSAKTLAYNPKTGKGPGYGIKGGDPDVRRLQAALNRLGLTDAKGRALKIDGKLGPLTTEAIKVAQTRLGLEPTGRVTPTLLKKLTEAKRLEDAAPKPKEGKKSPRLAVAQVLRELGFRHTPGGHSHNQLSHAGDLLSLAGRIELGDGESLVASGEIDPTEDAARVLYAVVDSPGGPQLRLGVLDPDGGDRWRAGNKGATANLSVAQAKTLRTELAAANDLAKRLAREADKQWDSGTAPTDPVLLGAEPVIDDGRVPSAWGDVRYDAWIADGEPTNWEIDVWISEDETADAAKFQPRELKKLLAKLDEFTEGAS